MYNEYQVMELTSHKAKLLQLIAPILFTKIGALCFIRAPKETGTIMKVLVVIRGGSNRLNNWGKALVYARKNNAGIIAVVLVEDGEQTAMANRLLAELAAQASVAEVALTGRVVNGNGFDAVE